MAIMTNDNLEQIDEKRKKKSLRGMLGVPVGHILSMSPQFGLNSVMDNSGDGIDSGGGVDEMIQVVKEMQDIIKKSKKNYEVYDVQESGIPLYTGQFQANMTDKMVEGGDTSEEMYEVHVKNPENGKIITIKHKKPENVKPRKSPILKKKKTDTDVINPRGWSSSYWSGRSVKELLAEIIEPDNVDVSQLKFNDELCPLLWDDLELKEDVRDALLKIAIAFIKSCKIDDYKYKDIVLVGSMANYTYTPQSDIDIHIVVDFNQFKVDETILGEYFDTKKDLWSMNHDVKIKGHAVECYIQNSNEPYTSIGVYSLAKDEWVREPVKKFVTVDEGNIQLKAATFMNAIDKLEKRLKNGEDVVNDLTVVKDKIKNMRKSGLYKEGEYSTENLVFKVLRNSGYLEKLINLKNNNIDQNLSI